DASKRCARRYAGADDVERRGRDLRLRLRDRVVLRHDVVREEPEIAAPERERPAHVAAARGDLMRVDHLPVRLVDLNEPRPRSERTEPVELAGGVARELAVELSRLEIADLRERERRRVDEAEALRLERPEARDVERLAAVGVGDVAHAVRRPTE